VQSSAEPPTAHYEWRVLSPSWRDQHRWRDGWHRKHPLHWDFAVTRSTTRSTAAAREGSVLVEEVLVDAFDHVRLLVLDANVVADHQPAQSQAVEQDDPGRNPVRVGDGLGREPAGGDEDPAIGLGPCRAPTNSWISGRPTALSAAYRLACT